MFVFSFKASTLKYIGVMAFCAMAIIVTVALIPSNTLTESVVPDAVAVSAEHKSADFKNIKTNADRVSFLKSYGWEVEDSAVSHTSIIIPEDFDELYDNYNKLQKKEGLDLKKYRGKKVESYTYRITNADDGIDYATLLIYKNRVIGGDVSSAEADGDMYSFSGE